MASLSKTLAAFGLVVTTLSGVATADTYSHIDQLALSIDRQAKRLVCESHHYRHTPEYRHLVGDARDLSRLADHVHEVAHHHGDIRHLESDVAQLDRKFHHLESIFDRIERRAAHGYGHIHGPTAHVKHILIAMEENIHHLQEDLRLLRAPVHPVHPVVTRRPPIQNPVIYSRGTFGPSHGVGHGHRDRYSGYGGYGAYNDFGYGSRGRGITIGGGSSRFTFRF